jgi:hypothetical protein
MKFSELLGNKFVRIVLLIFFFLFVYKILFAIGIFFAIDANILSMYLCWIGMVMFFAALLQTENTNFKVKSNSQDMSAASALLKQLTDTVKTATTAPTGTTDTGTAKGTDANPIQQTEAKAPAAETVKKTGGTNEVHV